MDGLFARLDPGGVAQYWEFPFTARSPLLSKAKRVERQFAAVKSSLRGQRGLTYAAGTTGYTALPTAVGLADKTIAGVAPPTRLLAEAGALIALVIVGASGVFLVARRRAEARTLFARGESVSSFAARTSVEALLPTLVGALLGLVVALGLIRLVEPHGTVETSTLLQGAFVAGGGVAVGLVLIGASAGIAYARLYEVGRRTHPVLAARAVGAPRSRGGHRASRPPAPGQRPDARRGDRHRPPVACVVPRPAAARRRSGDARHARGGRRRSDEPPPERGGGRSPSRSRCAGWRRAAACSRSSSSRAPSLSDS